MRALVGRIGLIASLAFVAPGSTASAQFRDTLQVGDRVRVRVASTRGNTNLFVGNLVSLSPDTLVLDLPGGKGTVTLPRSAIAEVALSSGSESRIVRPLRALPAFAPAAILMATLPAPRGPHANGFRNWRYVYGALGVLGIASLAGRQPNEKWEPVYRWLEGR